MVYVDSPQAHKAQQDMATAVTNMQATLHRMDAEVQNPAGWEGDARKAFVAVSTAWGEHSQRLRQTLDALATQVGAGAKHYDQMEVQNQDAFQHIRLP